MRKVALACAVVVALSGAPASGGDTVYISGRVLDHTGKPVAGAHVSYELRPNRELYNQQDCPMRPWEIQCKVHKVAGSTDAKGIYRLPVKLSSYLAQKRSHVLIVTDRPLAGTRAPARTKVTHYFTGKSEVIADLPVWRGVLSMPWNTFAGRTIDMPEQPPTLGTEYRQDYPDLELLQGADVVNFMPNVNGDRMVDSRTVETGITGMRAHAQRILGRLFPEYWTPEYALGDAVKPLSRGKACATYGKDDALLPLAGCRFTDGRLATPIPTLYQRANGKSCDVASACAHPKWVRIDLGSSQVVGAVGTRGCTPAAYEVSTDGTTYAPYATYDPVGDGLLWGAAVPVRYVRVDLGACTYKATEVSVFAPSNG